MEAQAFGSPVVLAPIGCTSMAPQERSIGDRLIESTRRRLFAGEDRVRRHGGAGAANGMVQLLGDENQVVGFEVVEERFSCRKELHGVKIRPFEIAVRVSHVVDERKWVGEVVGEYLRDCCEEIIRWRRSLVRFPLPCEVRGTSRTSLEDQNFAFPPVSTQQFDFPENDENDIDVMLAAPSDENTTAVEQRSQFTETSAVNSPDVGIVDGVPLGVGRRRYLMSNRRSRVRGPREQGESMSQKVTLESVLETKEKGGCKRNCLQDIDAKSILNQRYMAWGQRYEARATWIMQMLNTFYTRTGGTRRDKYETKIDGVLVCNACYAATLGYSHRRFKQLKASHAIYGRVAAVHGNTCQQKESARMSTTRESLDAFVNEAGCPQLHRSVRRKTDNAVLPLILLPMNTTKLDVFRYVNEEVKKIVDGSELSETSFRRLWRLEFLHVQIPPFSRFSKCYHCWEYKCGMESTTNAAAKEKIKEWYIRHIKIQMEERRNYWIFKRSAMITPDYFLCMIVDGMDQNTTMIPKMSQSVKNIESRFVKTHLCGVLVHGIGFYVDVWVDAHHKHDSNQVITSLMNVIGDVKRRKGSLAPTLRIQADNTTSENKNVYMFSMCVALVGLGFFKEVHLCFLIVGHTREDIDQRFSVISNVLKRRNIDTMEEMLEMVEKGTSYTEAFVQARKLEHICDWKAFITPHLPQGGEQLTGITLPHHMRFYMEQGVVRVQHKHLSTDEWGPGGGHLCLQSIPNVLEKPKLAQVFAADERELKALNEFIAYKEKLILRGCDPIRNMEVVDKIAEFKKYLREFPEQNQERTCDLPFWPCEIHQSTREGDRGHDIELEEATIESTISMSAQGIESRAVDLIMATMPNRERRGYFRPRKDRPHEPKYRSVKQARSRDCRMESARAAVEEDNGNPFPPFNPEFDVAVGHFVALQVELKEVRAGVPYYLAKVLELGQGNWAKKMKVLWYWPMLKSGVRDEPGSHKVRYTNCMKAAWEPSRETIDWVKKESAIYSWEDVCRRGRSGNIIRSSITVHGVQTEKTVIIPTEAQPHLLEYLAQQMDDMDDDRLENDLNV